MKPHILIATTALIAWPAMAQVSLHSIGTLGGNYIYSGAAGISADGSTIFGWSNNGQPNGPPEAVIWTAAGGMERLGSLGGTQSYSEAITADGSVIVGWSANAANWGRAFRWTRTTGMQEIGSAGGLPGSVASAITPDGTFICGRGYGSSPSVSFRWSAAGGIEEIGSSIGALALSADGRVVMCQGGQNGFIWTRDTGLQSLPVFNLFGNVLSQPAWISPDSQTVIGYGRDSTGDWNTGYRWTAATGYQSLIPGSVFAAQVYYASPNADLFLGTGGTGTYQAVLAGTTFFRVEGYLARRGVDLSDWMPGTVQICGASADLRVLVGLGRRLDTRAEGWIVTLPPGCYANCDSSTAPPLLSANDFQCFLNTYAAGDSFANCDASTNPPILNANDFQCFLNAFALGCP